MGESPDDLELPDPERTSTEVFLDWWPFSGRGTLLLVGLYALPFVIKGCA